MYVAESKINYENKVKVTSSLMVVKELKGLEEEQKEHFIGVYLNSQNQIVHKETISIGILTQSLVHPREVFIPAFKIPGVAYLIVVHNHPSGGLEISQEDREVTKRLKKAGDILGIELLDHIIISKNGYVSLRNDDAVLF